jgi:Fe-S-cluster-containing hydrogenase component 2
MSEEKKINSGTLSRREFLRDAGLVVGSTAVCSAFILTACGEELEITKTVTSTTTAPGATNTVTTTAPGTTGTQTATTTKAKYVCPMCDAEFETLALLKAHVETVHPQETVSLPKSIGHIVQIDDITSCAGCGSCESICGAVHEGAAGPNTKRIWLDRRPFDGHYYIKACLQCDDAPCYYACPYKDEALCIDKETGIRYINNDKCPSGCKLCLEACARIFKPPRINFDPETNKCIMCDLCKDRPEGPACIEFCPALCLEVGEGSEISSFGLSHI